MSFFTVSFFSFLFLCEGLSSHYLFYIMLDWLQIIFVSVEKDNEEIGEPVCAYFGVTGEGPQVNFAQVLAAYFSYILLVILLV